MAELQLHHLLHECALTSPETVANGICDVCYNDVPIEFVCNPCNFDLCKVCSKLKQRISHYLYPEHALEFYLRKANHNHPHVICSGCGNMSSGSFYGCKECEIYLDLGCAFLENTAEGWDMKELLHDSHKHLLKRCRPGPDAGGACLLCELPLSPSSICYGCVYCYEFLHEHCLDLPSEIQHPGHPAHPLIRLSYVQAIEKTCDVCDGEFFGVLFGCLECRFYLHLSCVNALLRGLRHECHEHMLFNITDTPDRRIRICQICMESVVNDNSHYRCIQCSVEFHITCLKIPQSVVNKSYHIHRLVRKIFQPKDYSLEYCGVCETILFIGAYAYCCEECDYAGHTECILREEVPSPLYLKDLYSCNKGNVKSTGHKKFETNELEDKLVVNDIEHIHVMRPVHMSELEGEAECGLCGQQIHESPCKCETCSFQSHRSCAELSRPSRHPFHNHPLTLLPYSTDLYLSKGRMYCDSCTDAIHGFHLLCPICNFSIHVRCALEGKKLFGTLHMGQKVTGTWVGRCRQDKHSMFEVIVSRSFPISCDICEEKLCGKALSCIKCGDIYHHLCTGVGTQTLFSHPLHPDHGLKISRQSGSKCLACKLSIIKYGYHCGICEVSFHVKCMEVVNVTGKVGSHKHICYNFWINESQLTRTCNVCARPCGASFYGCIDCKFKSHVECLGFPANVKSHRHQHTVAYKRLPYLEHKICSLCGLRSEDSVYACNHCQDYFHMRCILSMDDREAATEEEQVGDIYLMYIERHLLSILKEEPVLKDTESSEEDGSGEEDSDEDDNDEDDNDEDDSDEDDSG
ncbi:unnamed protein product [Microthlaspi erraticum]|uniref:Phorbol-ester/DAG-type domain-containing protein n=1 Tax=Microthlaspi erraticum TaxID=1685480 RepID=A0A6D2JSX5_9BRAS|nr:unnamed protein product [Microthlaspi erraticum]